MNELHNTNWYHTRTPSIVQLCAHTQINDVPALLALGIQPKAVGWALVKVFAELMLVQGYVHGDPHPGNAMVSVC